MRVQCEEVAVKLKYRAVRILDQALHEETGDPTEKTSKLDDYFIGALEYGPDDPEGRKQYVGAILDEARLGLGSMRWIDGTCYQGEWTHDKVLCSRICPSLSSLFLTNTFVAHSRTGTELKRTRTVRCTVDSSLKTNGVDLDRGLIH